ncbi:unnamed protein product [Acanthoscelides obtectus]|uniref:Uncharacterized protein n=1 Tax=Acanthoscelides obtectus TaxID=200917 RepID=A0A9P0PZJ8_ACAOB|nr:unnamed protein product [Acanthoscelides obtectus]CAK1668389.1 hypothetical protein AOBTE_LOCUS26367 [Acanthoscelides obtectus]
MVSLEQRRFLLSCCFVPKLLSNQIDCREILLNLNFTVPRLNSRNYIMFYLLEASTNKMLKCFNEVSHLFDFDIRKHIYKRKILSYLNTVQ